NASHEIRTPLAALAGYIETLQGPARDDTTARERFLKTMAAQVERMARLVSDLLSLSRIELTEHTPPADPVELGPIVRRVVTGLDFRAKAKQATVELALPADLPAVLGDEGELEQVFTNLIDNAIKYGRQGGKVRVEARVLDRVPARAGWPGNATPVAVAITDEGPGISREHLPRLTERFYRVDTARSRDMGGTGLGLAIVKHIVNRHRGAMTIDSTVGKGTTFTVYLPMAE
ncbi:sensor histidine kinase, partial [Zavarzinia sp.]|uniref:sensor histidine kinase n=1 Tax=Zavarzinia sp. TaxID=2027920 RepID=UPI003562C641